MAYGSQSAALGCGHRSPRWSWSAAMPTIESGALADWRLRIRLCWGAERRAQARALLSLDWYARWDGAVSAVESIALVGLMCAGVGGAALSSPTGVRRLALRGRSTARG